MKNPIIAAFLCAVLLITTVLEVSCSPSIKTPYVAVFVSQEFVKIWKHRHIPDKLHPVVRGWAEFDQFCKDVHKDAHGRPIVIDLDVHGNDCGLAVTLPGRVQVAEFGYVIKTIDKDLKGDDITLLVEACFPGNAYFYTIRGNENSNHDYPGIPSFPIFGVGSGFSNWGNTVYLQWLFGSQGFYEDLRNYETKIPNDHEPEDKFGMSVSCYKLMVLFNEMYYWRLDRIHYKGYNVIT